MWPFKKDRTEEKPKASELAQQAALRSLNESLKDRRDVEAVSGIVQYHLRKNHISERINILLREGQ